MSKPHVHGSLWPSVLCLGSHSISRELYNVFLIFRQSVCLTVNDDSRHISTIFTRVHLYLYIYISTNLGLFSELSNYVNFSSERIQIRQKGYYLLFTKIMPGPSRLVHNTQDGI